MNKGWDKLNKGRGLLNKRSQSLYKHVPDFQIRKRIMAMLETDDWSYDEKHIEYLEFPIPHPFRK